MIIFSYNIGINSKDSPQKIEQYRSKLSGPLLDRFDMHVEVPFQPARVTLAPASAEQTSKAWRARVLEARKRQEDRQGCLNSALQGEALTRHCALSEKQTEFLATTIDKLALSARATHRIMRLARSIADLKAQQKIDDNVLAQAMSYRTLK